MQPVLATFLHRSNENYYTTSNFQTKVTSQLVISNETYHTTKITTQRLERLVGHAWRRMTLQPVLATFLHRTNAQSYTTGVKLLHNR